MNWWNKAKEFLSEVRSEMRKVSFPTRDEVVATTIVVLVTSFVFAVMSTRRVLVGSSTATFTSNDTMPLLSTVPAGAMRTTLPSNERSR